MSKTVFQTPFKDFLHRTCPDIVRTDQIRDWCERVLVELDQFLDTLYFQSFQNSGFWGVIVFLKHEYSYIKVHLVHMHKL